MRYNVAALVDSQRPGGLEHLPPNAIDQQDRRRIGDRLGAPGVAYRVLYQVVSQTDTIAIFLADKRENIYRRLEYMGL